MGKPVLTLLQSPADFYADTYSPKEFVEFVSDRHETTSDRELSRRTYARIRVISSGVLTPSHAHRHPTLDPVSFMVAVEPLYFGVLPASVVPTVLTIVAAAVVGGLFVVPFVTKRLMAIADEVRAEISRAHARKSQ